MKSHTAKKKDIRELLGNPKITFVLGKNTHSSLLRRPCLGQGDPVRQAR